MGAGGLYAMGLEEIAVGAEDMGVGLGGSGANDPEGSSESESTEDFPPQFCPPFTTPQQFCLPTMGMGGFGMLGQQMPPYALQPQLIASSMPVFCGAGVSGMGAGGLYAMGLEEIAVGAEDMGVGLGGSGANDPEGSSESESTEDFPPQFCPPFTTPQQFCLPTMGMGGFGMLGQQMPPYALQPQLIASSMPKFSKAVVSKMGPGAMSGMGPGRMALGQGGMSKGESTEEFPPQLCPAFTTPQQFCMPHPNTNGMGGFGMPASMNGQQMLYPPQPPIVPSMQIIVKVKQGALEGVAGKLLDGSTFYKFRGIPYAQPPVGKLRFKDPLPPQPWTGIYDAKKNGKKCPQLDLSEHMILDGHEDCLFLNVFTKSLEPKALLPVMVFIHGGAFYTGSCNDNAYGPRYLVRHNVILVTMNYRLEALGFMCLDTPEVPGNAGIKDQVAALRWVKENIAQFGGDPNNVLLFGESAGSASVTFHLLSPMTRGLFQKAIAQSGSCLDKWLTGYDLRDRAFRLGKHLGKDTDDGEELLQFLQSVKALDLVNVTNPVLTLDELYRYPPLAWAPTVEKRFENVEPFLTELPIDVLLANKINKVPFMIGYTSKEGYLFLKYRLKKIEVYNKNVTYLLPADIIHNLSADNATEFGERVKRFYVGNGTFSNETSEEVTDDLTDSYFSANIHRFTDFYKNRLGSTIPIYMYKFSYDTQLNIFKAELGLANEKGAAHADDVAYLFESSENIEIYKAQDKAKKRVNMMTQLWTNFAKSGNPTPDNYFGVEWPQYTSQEKAYLNIDISMTKGIYADQERIRFWNNLYCEANLPCMSNDTYNDFKTSDYI